MEGFWIALFIVVLFLLVIVFLVLNNRKDKEFHHEFPFHKVEAPSSTSNGFLTSNLEPYPAEQLISIQKVEPKFEFGENSRSQPLARDGDYSEKSYSSKHENLGPKEMNVFDIKSERSNRSEKSEKDPNRYSQQEKPLNVFDIRSERSNRSNRSEKSEKSEKSENDPNRYSQQDKVVNVVPQEMNVFDPRSESSNKSEKSETDPNRYSLQEKKNSSN